jgi:hypothetical protein
MSNKLTREVKYLNESDRPKKVEPLKFKAWFEANYYLKTKDFELEDIDIHVERYSTYLQEFSAEEKAVEFSYFLDTHKGLVDVLNNHPLHSAGTITYLGKCRSLGDTFSSNDGTYIRFYSGHLHSGKF